MPSVSVLRDVSITTVPVTTIMQSCSHLIMPHAMPKVFCQHLNIMYRIGQILNDIAIVQTSTNAVKSVSLHKHFPCVKLIAYCIVQPVAS